MIRGFFRLIGVLLLAGGFIFMVYDGARWVADQNLRFTQFGQFWNDMNQSSQLAFRTWVEGKAPWFWTSFFAKARLSYCKYLVRCLSVLICWMSTA